MTKMTDTRLVEVLDAKERSHLTMLRATGCKCPVPLMAPLRVPSVPGCAPDVVGTLCRLCKTEARYPVATSHSKFETVHVGYMLRQAQLLFSTTAGRPMLSVEGGRVVHDESAAASDLRSELRGYAAAVQRVEGFVTKAQRVPATVRAVLDHSRSMVTVLSDQRLVSADYVAEFERMMRFLDQYDHNTAVSVETSKTVRCN